MSSTRAKKPAPRASTLPKGAFILLAGAFTLLEVMLAVAIVGLVAVSMFRFLNGNLQAIRVSTKVTERRELLRALATLVQRQMDTLAPLKEGAVLGDAHTYNNNHSDELSWKSAAGNGLLTDNATGEYVATLELRLDAKSGTPTLSLNRWLANKKDEPHWIDLIDHVAGIQFTYFDPAKNSWQDRWTDAASRPSLIRMRVFDEQSPDPYEVVLSVPQLHPPSG